MTRHGEIVAVIEVKGKWTLPIANLISQYNINAAISNSIHQLYNYMRLNHRKYGILTSYDYAWFAYNSKDCSFCNESPGHETLFISEGIAYNSQRPSLLQRFTYFNSLVDYEFMESPPTSTRPSRASSAANRNSSQHDACSAAVSPNKSAV